MSKGNYIIPIEDFENRFPWIFNHMKSFEELDDYLVYINLDDGKTLLYDNFTHEYKTVKRFTDDFELTEDEWKLGFSKLLAKRLRCCGLNQYDLAKRIGVSTTMVNHYINGRNVPSIYTMKKIVKVLGCSLDDLYPHDYIILD